MDATVKPAAVLGLDEGKRSHWACLLAADGEIPANRSVANREPDLADLFGTAPSGTLVVVDQVRNIGDLPIRMARKAGLDVAYLSGIAEHNAAKLLHGDSKTDERDAPAIAKTALGMPSALLPCPDEGEAVAAALDGEITALLASDETYRCLMTVPGIGARTASELVIGIDIALFRDHGRLASYCGLAPRDRKSGSSVSSVTASRRGNKRLKNLLIFSCNSLVRSDSRFGRYYRMLREERHMPHGKALKAVARKRLKVICAIMRDKVPYAA